MRVSSPVSYHYGEQALRAAPCHYRHTPFEGREFLQAYWSSRSQLRQRLMNQCARLFEQEPVAFQTRTDLLQAAVACELLQRVPVPSLSEAALAFAVRHQLPLDSLRLRKTIVLPSPPSIGRVETAEVLMDTLHAWLFHPMRYGLAPHEWTEVLLKKFEVSKRLALAYTPSLSPDGTAAEIPLVYALLALLLMVRYEQLDNLKYLNALLKLNDLVREEAEERWLSQVASLIAIQGELTAVSRLAVRWDVALTHDAF